MVYNCKYSNTTIYLYSFLNMNWTLNNTFEVSSPQDMAIQSGQEEIENLRSTIETPFQQLLVLLRKKSSKKDFFNYLNDKNTASIQDSITWLRRLHENNQLKTSEILQPSLKNFLHVLIVAYSWKISITTAIDLARLDKTKAAWNWTLSQPARSGLHTLLPAKYLSLMKKSQEKTDDELTDDEQTDLILLQEYYKELYMSLIDFNTISSFSLEKRSKDLFDWIWVFEEPLKRALETIVANYLVNDTHDDYYTELKKTQWMQNLKTMAHTYKSITTTNMTQNLAQDLRNDLKNVELSNNNKNSNSKTLLDYEEYIMQSQYNPKKAFWFVLPPKVRVVQHLMSGLLH